MALTVKQLNGDSSFLLSFEPIGQGPAQQPFRILLDPWLPGPASAPDQDQERDTYSKKYHEFEKDCISSVRELPELDLVIVSRDKSDHCNKDTLKELSRTNSNSVILAEPAAAKLIRSWKFFEKDKVLTLERWEDPRVTGRETTTRVSVPPQHLGGDPGEVTISFITQKKDRWRAHAAVGITYRPPPCRPLSFYRPLLTSPVTPRPPVFRVNPRLPSPPPLSPMILHFRHNSEAAIPPFPPPNVLHKKRLSYDPSMADSVSQSLFLPPPPPAPPTPSPPEFPRLYRNRSNRSIASVAPHARDRSISIIFSPHGIAYQSLEPYATTHLVTEAALPLTALLHCFDAVAGPWWLPGSANSGLPDGQKIATALGAKAWVSAHDTGRDTRQGWAGRMAGRMARTRRYRHEVRRKLDQSAWDSGKKAPHTEIMALAIGDEVALTSEGVYEPNVPKKPRVTSMIF
ncbi:hypothetical protein BKA56DRAFT_607704 [Ilyonectria sp. MPI-CAGE-AT-0026]|nr:hypothetical protein BKA56DRAFT_607704 [Ilyonectria sp. MPI-CAGE-AT-0026]